jgi:hypothetical protein
MVALIIFESVRYAKARDEERHHGHEHHEHHEHPTE